MLYNVHITGIDDCGYPFQGFLSQGELSEFPLIPYELSQIGPHLLALEQVLEITKVTIEVVPHNPEPGECYALSDDKTVEWLFVREHPDDTNLVLLVPGDQFHLVGTTDVKHNNNWTYRCNLSDWYPKQLLAFDKKTESESFTRPALLKVKALLANMAKGRDWDREGNDDDQPEYQSHIEKLGRIIHAVRSQSTLQGTIPHRSSS